MALEGKQPDYVPTFELAFQLTEEAFGESFCQGKENDDLPEKDRMELCRRNAELYLKIAERYEHSIIMISTAPSSVYPQRSQELVWTMNLIRNAARKKGEDYLLITHGDATFAIPEGDWMNEMIELLADNPEKLKEKAERMIYERSGHYLFYAMSGFDGFALCDDYAFNANPFFSPDQFREYVQPYLSRIISSYRQLGKYVIKHTDGNIMPIFDQLVECRPHAIHSLDPQGQMDMAEVKRRYGRQVALCGNVNCGLIQTGTESEIIENCEYSMRYGKPGGGYVFCTSNCAFKGMPLKRYELVNEYWRKNRSYLQEPT
jgi:uroporphyrinogen decarboxylase